MLEQLTWLLIGAGISLIISAVFIIRPMEKKLDKYRLGGT